MTFAARRSQHPADTAFEYELTDFANGRVRQTCEFKIWDPSPKIAQADTNSRKQATAMPVASGRRLLEARATLFGECALCAAIEDGVYSSMSSLGSGNANMMLALTLRRALQPAVKSGQLNGFGFRQAREARLWTLEDPYLYEVKVELRQADDNKGGDVVKTYFGFREIGVGKNPNGDNYVTLNGKPIYLQLCLDQSYHPEGWYTFPSDEFMKNEIMISKKLGLSGNRVHIKVEVPRKLYWADKLGVLIQADVPCAWGDVSEKMFEEHWKCFTAMVKRDYNHPSIYQWTLFNETWGLFSTVAADGSRLGNAQEARYRAWTQAAWPTPI